MNGVKQGLFSAEAVREGAIDAVEDRYDFAATVKKDLGRKVGAVMYGKNKGQQMQHPRQARLARFS